VKGKLIVDMHHKIAAFLNPAMKKLTSLFTEEEAKEVRQTVAEMIQEVHASTSQSAGSSAVGSKADSTGDLSEFECFFDEAESGKELMSEIDVYLGYNPPKKDFDLLDFWKSQSASLSKLSALARKVLGAPAGSSPSERLFSNAGNIFTVKRTSLSSEKLDDLLFLMWNKTCEIAME